MRQALRRHDIEGQSDALEREDECPSKINLSRLKSELGRSGERMVIVVPAFAHADQASDLHVITLNASAPDHPCLAALLMSVMPNQPVTGHGNRDPCGHTPDQPGQAADRVK